MSIRWKGVIRDKTDRFRGFKDGKEAKTSASSSIDPIKESRFKRISSNIMNLADDESDMESQVKGPSEREVSISSGDQTLEDDAGVDVRDQKYVDEVDDNYQPPYWVVCKDEIDENMKKIEIKFEKLKLLERQRVTKIFKTTEVDDVQGLVQDITYDIRTNEEKLKEIKRYKPQSDTDAKIKANVEIVVAKQLQEMTQSLRQRQRNYVTKLKELHGGEDSKINLSDEYDEDELDMEELEEYRSKYKDKEIQELSESVRDLAVLFKELSTLVIEQGTIIDRIDYNVESALVSTEKGRKHLVSARKAQKSNRSRSILMCLAVLILIFLVLLIMKKA